jgi:hypothetical protein
MPREYKTSEAQRRASSNYRNKNKDKAAAWAKQWYHQNKERISAQRKERYRLKKLAQARAAMEAAIDAHRLFGF